MCVNCLYERLMGKLFENSLKRLNTEQQLYQVEKSVSRENLMLLDQIFSVLWTSSMTPRSSSEPPFYHSIIECGHTGQKQASNFLPIPYLVLSH